jgi:hypothetical protein
MFADRAYQRGLVASSDRLASLLYFAAACLLVLVVGLELLLLLDYGPLLLLGCGCLESETHQHKTQGAIRTAPRNDWNDDARYQQAAFYTCAVFSVID